jgi:hypothetical protein
LLLGWRTLAFAQGGQFYSGTGCHAKEAVGGLAPPEEGAD